MTVNNCVVSGLFESYRDSNGSTIIDLSGGFGFQVPEIIDAVVRQADLMGLSNRVLVSEPLINLCTAVATLLPDPLDNSYVCSSGDEAFEGALKLCKGLHPKRKTIVYLEGGDYGSLSYGRCMSAPDRYQEMTRFLGLRLTPIKTPDDLQTVDWNDCFAACHTYLHYDAAGKLGLPSDATLECMYRQARGADVPIIGMDVDTCMGCLGTMFGHQRIGRAPDIVVTGGSLGGGAVPIGMYTCPEAMAYRVYGRSTPAKHGSTTAGNPLSCIAALAALEYAQRTDTPQRCISNGQLVANALCRLGARSIGSVVSIPVADRTVLQGIQQRLLSQGLYIPEPVGQELVLRLPITARPEILMRAITVVRETMTNATNFAA